MTDYDPAADSLGSWKVAIAELKRRREMDCLQRKLPALDPGRLMALTGETLDRERCTKTLPRCVGCATKE